MKNSGRNSRMTKQRRLILEEVRRMMDHPTADEVYEAVRKTIPRISLGTVYRNLDVLAESGEIARLKNSGNQSRFDGDTSNHYHVRCTECGRIANLKGVDVEVDGLQLGAACGFEVVGHWLEFQGVCPACKGGRSLFENVKRTN
jgi:Fur family transcriptional regulator, peroxide stress response regulator